MGNLKHKTEGGQGGRRGHSNMDHWVYTEEIKDATRKRRRSETKSIIRNELDNLEHEDIELDVIHVPLHDEGTAVWRPVPARQLDNDTFQIPRDTMIPKGENWKFAPGDIVKCEERTFQSGYKSLVAIKRIREQK